MSASVEPVANNSVEMTNKPVEAPEEQKINTSTENDHSIEEKKEEILTPEQEVASAPDEKIDPVKPKPKEIKTEEEKKQELLERQTAIIVQSIKEFVGGKRLSAPEIVKVIAYAMTIAAKMKIDNQNKKIVVVAGIKSYINGTSWPEDDKIVLIEFVDLTISSTIDSVADYHKGKVKPIQGESGEMASKSMSVDSQKSCCVVM